MTIEERAAPTRESANAWPQPLSPTDGRAKSWHRVALVLNDMNAAGGIQNAAANLARSLEARFDVILLTVYSPSDGVASRLQLTLRTLNLRPEGGRPYPRLRRLSQMLLAGVRLRRILAAETIDTVICFQHDIAVVAALALPVDVRKISYEHAPFAAISRGWARLRRRGYPRLDAAVTLDQENRTNFAAITRRTLVIPHEVGVRPSTTFENRERMLLFVGDIAHRNGLDRLLWAIKEPLQAYPEWKLVLVALSEVEHSEHWYINYLHDLMELLHLSANVELHAAVRPPEHFYRRASMFVTGCRWELLPTMLLEAKAYGLPVVSYDHPVGLRDVVRDGVDGFIVNEGLTSFGAAVTRLIEDATLRRQMGEAGLDDVRDRFGAAQVCAQWTDLIEAVHVGRAA